MKWMYFLVFLLLIFIQAGCEGPHPDPIEMPDPMDTMVVDSPPVDPIPPTDTIGEALMEEIEGNYIGTCYYQSVSAMTFYDTLYNQTITIDSIWRENLFDVPHYLFWDQDSAFLFRIPETEFEKDSVYSTTTNPPYQKTYNFIRSQKFLYSRYVVSLVFGFQKTECYCYKQ